uniref:Uncharacterized protein n=1 Tax=Myotis myotis TaxID=51298 RepID=A0A7J7WHB1_MYOMY|nr:hypothetical protein mMyoMyo1_012035 [Myotis myotis]
MAFSAFPSWPPHNNCETECGVIDILVLFSYCSCNESPQALWLNTNVSFHSFGSPLSEMDFATLKSRCQLGCTPSGDFREEFIFLPFLLLKATHIPWLTAPSSIFTASSTAPSPFLTSALSHLPLTLRPPSYKEPYHSLGPHR